MHLLSFSIAFELWDVNTALTSSHDVLFAMLRASVNDAAVIYALLLLLIAPYF
jgi:hypothetical protein